MSSIAPPRPSAPDAGLLDEAGLRMAELFDVPRSARLSWDVGPRIDRPRSSVFPLLAHIEGQELGSAFYKVMRPSTKGETERYLLRVDRAMTGLARARGLEDRLAEKLRDEPIAFSRALVVDVDALTSVTLGVAGEPFGSVSKRIMTPSRLDRATRWLELTGRAAGVVESCSPADIEDREDERTDLMERRLDRAEQWLTRDAVKPLRRRVRDLYEEAMAGDQPLIYAHGDFSPTNLLVGDGVGLIDFEWVPRLRMFDLANLVFRLEYDTMLPRKAVAPLLGAAIRGYGQKDVTASPFWRLHRISNLLKVVRDGPAPRFNRRSGRVRRALWELETLPDPD